MGKKPKIRILRNMARSGGTLIGKCIGCMDGVVMISELHPGNMAATKPMMQAHKWFDLVTKRDLAMWKMSKGPSMLQFVARCQTRASGRGDVLVLRDWSHLDYIGKPFVEPGYGFALADSLGDAYEVVQISTTRHPVDQYLSLQSFPGFKDLIPVDAYLKGCVAFAEFAAANGFVRYEDFVADPDAGLGKICDALEIEFDASYAKKWHQYTTITGDNANTGGRSSEAREIRPMPRKAVDEELMDRFRVCQDYERACSLLGYEA